MVANIRGYTANYGLKLINFDTPRWHTLEYSNWELVDAIMASTGLPGLRGEWINSTAYIAGERVFDAADGKIYGCLVTHTSAATGTFAADRAAHPTYWRLETLDTPRYMGAWAPGFAYSVADIVVVGAYTYYICGTKHTSASTFPPDAPKWALIFDATAAVNSTNANATAAAGSASQAATSASSASTSATNAQASAVESAAQAAKLYGTSTTSNTVGLGAKTFVTQAGKYFNDGKFLMVRADLDPVYNWMWGQVVSYGGTTLFFNALTSAGSGTYVAWTIDVSGSRGAIGPQGPQGELGPPLVIKGTVPTAGALPPTGNTIGDMYIAEDTQNLHIWDGTMWDNAGPLGTSTTTTADNPPSNPKDGDMWWESDSGIFWVRYDDGSSSQWIQAGGAAASINQNAVLKTGDTMTGNLIIEKNTPVISLKDVVGSGSYLQGYKNGNIRWNLALGDINAETGSNAGSDFRLFNYNDAGGGIGTPLVISRATGAMVLSSTVASTSPTTGALTVAGGLGVGGNAVFGKNATLKYGEAGGGIWCDSITASQKYFVGTDNLTEDFRIYENLPVGANVLTISGTNGTVRVNRTDLSTSPTTGALTVAGGLGVGTSLVIGAPGAVSVPITQATVKVLIGGGTGIASRPQVDSTWHYTFENVSGGIIGSIACNATATAYNTSSDASLKEDLKSFDAGSIIDNTEVYDFAWKSTKERNFGVIAQQAVDVYPQAITHTEASTEKGAERDEWWGVDYSKYVPVLLQELKALRARVADLEGRAPEAPKRRSGSK